ncbi:amidase family protein [Shimia sp. SDUM112013]|uniref:amidase family protein n=1 Tax=Shimia sp. SDUM112013 TaxID=3136160 RepID=UPI0032EBFFC7
MTQDKLWQASANELAKRIAAGEVSAVDAVTASVERMRAVNPAINAVVDDLGDAAIAEARGLDSEFAKNGPVGPLHGVPVTIKENIDQKGHATPNGVVAFKDLIAPDDAPFVTNLRQAGAIVIGRTNTPEFSFRGTTDNPLHGRTFNPWNDWASSGGSSGGASSAVMSGMGAIAHGNDIGGSLRFPSTATGAATVKPGLGRTPAYNPSQKEERGLIAQLMSVQGVIAREVADVRLAMKSAIHYDPHDPWQVPMPFEGPAVEGPVKVAFTRNAHGFELHPAVDKALTTARDCLIDAGYDVVEAEPPNARLIGEEATRTLFGETKALLLDTMRQFGSPEFNTYWDHCLEIAPPYEGDDLLRAFARRSGHLREWQLFLHEYPLVLTPFLLQPIYAWNRDMEGREGAEEVMLKGFYSFAMNFMGLPAGNVPANYNDGLPIGVQIVGRRFREDMILDACEAIEDRVGIMAHKLFERD